MGPCRVQAVPGASGNAARTDCPGQGPPGTHPPASVWPPQTHHLLPPAPLPCPELLARPGPRQGTVSTDQTTPQQQTGLALGQLNSEGDLQVPPISTSAARGPVPVVGWSLACREQSPLHGSLQAFGRALAHSHPFTTVVQPGEPADSNLSHRAWESHLLILCPLLL